MIKINYIIYLTERCNLKCKYCEHVNKNEDIDIETMDNILEEIKLDPSEYISLSLFGGEPLLNDIAIFHLFKQIKQINKKFIISFTTNLTMMNDEILNLFAENKEIVNISVSIDGDRETTDFNRGKGTYDKVIHNMNKLRINEIPFAVSAVLDITFLSKFNDNFLHLYNLGIYNFSFFLNYNNPELILNPIYLDLFKTELAKVIDSSKNLNKLKNLRIDRIQVNMKDNHLEDYLPCNGGAVHFGVTGNRFNCIRYKYNSKESNILIDLDQIEKCKNCKSRKYCCTCFGNDSFLFNNNAYNLSEIDIKAYQQKYCIFIKTYTNMIFKHWKYLEENIPEQEISTITVRDKIFPLVIDPKYLDFGSDEDIYLILNNANDFIIKGNNKAFAIVNPSKPEDENKIRELCKEKNITTIN